VTAVVTKTVAQLIDDARTHADMLNTTAVGMTDARILGLLNERAQELHDLILGVDNSYYIDKYDFSLPDSVLQALYTAKNLGTAPANWSACPDGYYKDVGLDMNPTQPTPITCRNFNFAERNNPNRRTWHTYKPVGRKAGVQVLEHLCGNSSQNTAGDYRLWFVGRAPVLAEVTTVDVTAGINAVDGTLKQWTLENAAFTDADVGTSLVVSGAVNAANNGTFLITAVMSATVVTTVLGSPTSEALPVTASVTYQAGGTVGELDDVQQIWNEYLTIGAAVDMVRIEEGDTNDLERRLAGIRDRVLNMAANRTSEPEALPVVETFGGPGYDGFWDPDQGSGI
jgi:hypothetical protein